MTYERYYIVKEVNLKTGEKRYLAIFKDYDEVMNYIEYLNKNRTNKGLYYLKDVVDTY